MAMENPNITADMVELTEFPHLAQRYQVRGVPKTVINEEHSFDGGLPEGAAIEVILSALDERS